MMMFSGLGLFFLLLIFINGVNGYPKEDLIITLPGQPKVAFKQYGGYVDIDEKAGRSLFYYFVEAEKNADELPLTLWMNGGDTRIGNLDLTYNAPGTKDYIHKGGLKKDVPFLEDVVVMKDVAHFIHEEKPDEINKHIYDFIRKFSSN